jgi:hypothetical protein
MDDSWAETAYAEGPVLPAPSGCVAGSLFTTGLKSSKMAKW